MTTKKNATDVNPEVNIQKIYIGPSFKGINQNTTFLNGLPPQLKKYEKSKALKGLLVSVDDFVNAQKELKQTGSYRNCMYKQFEKEITK